jgi:NitT/TauT family transport system substrate-binding protein
LNSKGSSAEYLAETLLRQGNLQPSDVEYVEMSFGDMGAAFAGQTIDVAVGGEPTATGAVDRGLATKWLCGADILPNLQFTYLLYSSQFADQRTDVAQRWMAAYLRGAREWQTMLQTGQGRDAMLSVVGKYTPVKDLALLERATLPVPAAEARIDVTNIVNQITWLHERGYISHEPWLDRFVDMRFVQQATQDVRGN